MIDGVVADFLDSLNERELTALFPSLLRALGYVNIHVLHGSGEFGKDLIAKRETEEPYQFAFQLKVGDIAYRHWQNIRGQLDELRTNPIAHSGFRSEVPWRAVLVTTGRLIGNAPAAAQQYAEHLAKLGEEPILVWDRETLIEIVLNTPETGLALSDSTVLISAYGAASNGTSTENALEEFSRSWINTADPPNERTVLECATVANKLRTRGRRDLACYLALCLIRGIWASRHNEEPPQAQTVALADTASDLFCAYAEDLFQDAASTPATMDPREVLRRELGVFVTYPVKCARVCEVIGLLALRRRNPSVDDWLAHFIAAHPGAAHPISDRWACSLLSSAVVLGRKHRKLLEAHLLRVTKWIADHYDSAPGLATAHAPPSEEIAYLLGASLPGVDTRIRSDSYLAAVVLDLMAALEFTAAYRTALNEFLAVGIHPAVPLPNDDRDQYRIDANDIPTDVAVQYEDADAGGPRWQRARHHEALCRDHYLGRIGRLWDAIVVSSVVRDRHDVAVLRALYEQARADEPSEFAQG